MLTGKLFHHSHKEKASSDAPLYYTLVVHSPIVIENLLPSGAYYEILNLTTAEPLWSAYIGPLGTKLIHTVPLNVPLLMNICLRNCKSEGGVVIHKVKHEKERGGGFGRIQQALEGLLETEEAGEGKDEGQYDNIFLVDLAGQRLRLQVVNSKGAGGQRTISVYCPYWILNTSQFTVRLREDGNPNLPAGTYSSQGNGTKALSLTEDPGMVLPKPNHNLTLTPLSLIDFFLARILQSIYCLGHRH